MVASVCSLCCLTLVLFGFENFPVSALAPRSSTPQTRKALSRALQRDLPLQTTVAWQQKDLIRDLHTLKNTMEAVTSERTRDIIKQRAQQLAKGDLQRIQNMQQKALTNKVNLYQEAKISGARYSAQHPDETLSLTKYRWTPATIASVMQERRGQQRSGKFQVEAKAYDSHQDEGDKRAYVIAGNKSVGGGFEDHGFTQEEQRFHEYPALAEKVSRLKRLSQFEVSTSAAGPVYIADNVPQMLSINFNTFYGWAGKGDKGLYQKDWSQAKQDGSVQPGSMRKDMFVGLAMRDMRKSHDHSKTHAYSAETLQWDFMQLFQGALTAKKQGASHLYSTNIGSGVFRHSTMLSFTLQALAFEQAGWTWDRIRMYFPGMNLGQKKALEQRVNRFLQVVQGWTMQESLAGVLNIMGKYYPHHMKDWYQENAAWDQWLEQQEAQMSRGYMPKILLDRDQITKPDSGLPLLVLVKEKSFGYAKDLFTEANKQAVLTKLRRGSHPNKVALFEKAWEHAQTLKLDQGTDQATLSEYDVPRNYAQSFLRRPVFTGKIAYNSVQREEGFYNYARAEGHVFMDAAAHHPGGGFLGHGFVQEERMTMELLAMAIIFHLRHGERQSFRVSSDNKGPAYVSGLKHANAIDPQLYSSYSNLNMVSKDVLLRHFCDQGEAVWQELRAKGWIGHLSGNTFGEVASKRERQDKPLNSVGTISPAEMNFFVEDTLTKNFGSVGLEKINTKQDSLDHYLSSGSGHSHDVVVIALDKFTKSTYTLEDLARNYEQILLAFQMAKKQGRPVMHTTALGAGAFMNSRMVSFALQAMAALQSGWELKQVVFHTMTERERELLKDFLRRIRDLPTEKILQMLAQNQGLPGDRRAWNPKKGDFVEYYRPSWMGLLREFARDNKRVKWSLSAQPYVKLSEIRNSAFFGQASNVDIFPWMFPAPVGELRWSRPHGQYVQFSFGDTRMEDSPHVPLPGWDVFLNIYESDCDRDGVYHGSLPEVDPEIRRMVGDNYALFKAKYMQRPQDFLAWMQLSTKNSARVDSRDKKAPRALFVSRILKSLLATGLTQELEEIMTFVMQLQDQSYQWKEKNKTMQYWQQIYLAGKYLQESVMDKPLVVIPAMKTISLMDDQDAYRQGLPYFRKGPTPPWTSVLTQPKRSKTNIVPVQLPFDTAKIFVQFARGQTMGDLIEKLKAEQVLEDDEDYKIEALLQNDMTVLLHLSQSWEQFFDSVQAIVSLRIYGPPVTEQELLSARLAVRS